MTLARARAGVLRLACIDALSQLTADAVVSEGHRLAAEFDVLPEPLLQLVILERHEMRRSLGLFEELRSWAGVARLTVRDAELLLAFDVLRRLSAGEIDIDRATKDLLATVVWHGDPGVVPELHRILGLANERFEALAEASRGQGLDASTRAWLDRYEAGMRAEARRLVARNPQLAEAFNDLPEDQSPSPLEGREA